MTTHTPAPWYTEQPKNADYWRVYHADELAGDPYMLAHVYTNGTKGRNEANARLIAAAPELLDALQDCYSELNQLAFLSNDKLAKITLEKARAAIQKALGKE